MKTSILALLLILGLLPIGLFGQVGSKGQIIRPSTGLNPDGTKVLDPNGDGYVSATNSQCLANCGDPNEAGISTQERNNRIACRNQCTSCTTACPFSTDGYYLDEFEIKMFPIPQLDGDVTGDSGGPNCGISDLIPDVKKNSAYAAYNKVTGNMVFRFRVGNDNNSVESYSILLDTDGLIGAADPNSTPENPGFEIDITLIKRNNAGIYIYDIDGIDSCPTELKKYDIGTYFQIAYADLLTCGDPDYFYDYYVPFKEVLNLYNNIKFPNLSDPRRLTEDTGLRYVALTNQSATCAMAGQISDISGVDNNQAPYAGCNSCAFLALVENQCTTPATDLTETGAGFEKEKVYPPSIKTPLWAGQKIVSGKTAPEDASKNIYLLTEVYTFTGTVVNNVVTVASWQSTPRTTIGTVANGENWSVDLTQATSNPGPLQPFDRVKVSAKLSQNSTGCSGGGNNVSTDEYTTQAVPPVAYNQSVTTNEDTAIEITLTAEVKTGYALTYAIATNPANGTLGTLNTTTGKVTYTPNGNFNGSDSFTFTASYDGTANYTTTPATVSITVTPINDAPDAVNDAFTTNEDVALTTTVAGNDISIDGPATNYSLTTGPTSGTLLFNSNGSFTYTPNANFNGTDSFVYSLCDGATPNLCDQATVTITVNAINDAPVAVNNSITTNEDTPVTFSVTNNDTDVDGNNTINVASVDLNPATPAEDKTFTVVGQGVYTVDNAGNVTFTPATNYFGNATPVNYTVKDNSGALSNSAQIQVTVLAVIDAPIAVSDAATTAEDTPVTFSVTTNDTDSDGSINAATVDLNPATPAEEKTFTVTGQGVYTVDNAGNVTFTPAANFNGTATPISYTVKDNENNLSNTAQIQVTVTSVNDAPVAVNDAATTAEDTPITFSITNNDTDVDGTINAATVDLDPSSPTENKTFTVVGQGVYTVDNTGNVTFTPASNYFGTATPITYTVKDNSGTLSNAAQIQITVTAVIDFPVAVNDAATTNEDTPVTFSVTNNDTDSDGSINVATVDLDPATPAEEKTFTVTGQGVYTADNAGNVTFTPTANYNGTATPISYRVKDNQGNLSNIAQIQITVTPIVDAPVAVDNTTVTTNEDTPVTFSVTNNDTDSDGTINAATVDLNPATPAEDKTFTVAGQGVYTVDNAGNVTFTPAANYNGTTTSIGYTVKDNAGNLSNTAQITVTVNPVNDAPVALNQTIRFDLNTPVNFTLTALDNDNAQIDLSFTVLVALPYAFPPGTIGIVSVNGGVPNLTFTPDPAFSGTVADSYTFTFQASDGALNSNIGTITLRLNDTNTYSPIANNDNASTNEDVPVTFSVTANDNDPDGSINVATVDLNPATVGEDKTFIVANQGTYTVDNLGNVTFTPVANFNGPTTPITYTVKDNSALLSNSAQISITVNPVSDNPVAVNDAASTSEDTPVTFSITNNDTDADGNNTINVATVDLDPTTAGEQKSFSITGQGTFAVDASGDVTFTPAANYEGTVNPISYTIKDNDGNLSNIAQIQVTISQVTEVPVAVNDAATTNEDTAITFSVTNNDTDSDGTINAATVDLNLGTPAEDKTLTNTQGTYTVDNAGNVTFTPAANFNGVANPINYTVKDNGGALSNTAQIQVTVNAVMDLPVAVSDVTNTNEDTPVTFSIIANDTDADGNGTINANSVDLDPSTGTEDKTFTVTGQGTYTVNSLGSLTFTPVGNYNGTATPISYTIKDSDGNLSNTAQIQITVNSADDNPVAVNDAATTNEDTPVTFSITINDTDADGTINAATVDLNPSTVAEDKTFTVTGQGTYTVDNLGNVTFTPVLNYNGTATAISYTVKDNDAAISNAGQLQIVVSPVNDAPAVVPATVAIDEDKPTSICFTVTDVENDPSVLTGVVSLGGNGSLALDPASGQFCFLYTPVQDYNGTDQVQVTICDANNPNLCSTGVITININPVNDNPTVIDGGVPVTKVTYTTAEDTPLNFCVNTNDIEINNVSASTITNISGGGTMVSIPGGPNQSCFTFTPAAQFTGKSVWEIVFCDDGTPSLCTTLTVEITVTPVNDAPVSDDQSVTVTEDTATSITLTATDADGDVLTYTIVTPPAHGTLTIVNNVVTYTPDPNYTGSDSFTYKSNDGSADSNEATVDLTITPVNDAQQITPIPVLTVNEDTVLEVCLGVTDVDGDEITYNLPTNNSGGGTMKPSDRLNVCFDFTPPQDYNGDSFWTMSVCDNGNPSLCTEIIVQIVIVPVNDAPVSEDQAVTTPEDTPLTITLKGTDVDASDVLTYTIVTQPANGTITITGGNVAYTPAANYFGSDTFTFKTNDGTVDSNIATVTITVTPVNDAPVAENQTVTTAEDTPKAITLSATDVEANTLTYSIVANPTHGTLSGTGANRTYTPNLNYFGTDSFTFRANDGTNDSNTATVTITVTPVDDLPVAVNDFLTVRSFENSEVINLLSNDRDIDLKTLQLITTPSAGPFHGEIVSINATGAFQYKSTLGFMGMDSVRYKVCYTGSTALCDEGVVFIEVTPAAFKIYEGFSPNGDGLNDYWRIDGIETYPNNKIQIFDRFNNLVYQTNGYSNEGNPWTGQANHGLISGTLPEGTYFYSINLGDGSGLLSGFVVLKKN